MKNRERKKKKKKKAMRKKVSETTFVASKSEECEVIVLDVTFDIKQ